MSLCCCWVNDVLGLVYLPLLYIYLCRVNNALWVNIFTTDTGVPDGSWRCVGGWPTPTSTYVYVFAYVCICYPRCTTVITRRHTEVAANERVSKELGARLRKVPRIFLQEEWHPTTCPACWQINNFKYIQMQIQIQMIRQLQFTAGEPHNPVFSSVFFSWPALFSFLARLSNFFCFSRWWFPSCVSITCICCSWPPY